MAPKRETSRRNGLKGGRPKGVHVPAHALARYRGRARSLRQMEITAERVMMEIGRIAFTDRSIIWRDGQVLPLDEWPQDALALLEGFEVVVKNAAAGDGHQDVVHKVHLAKKIPALEILAKHFGLIVDKVDVTLSVSQDILAKLDAIKERNRLRAEGTRADTVVVDHGPVRDADVVRD